MPAAPRFTLALYHGAGSYTITEASEQRVLSRKYEHDENYPSKLTVTLENNNSDADYNLLNAACSVWTAGTGPLEIGDIVELSVEPTTTGVLTLVFRGIVRKITPQRGKITVEAQDTLCLYDEIRQDRIYYANYRDTYPLEQYSDGASGAVLGVDATMAYPAVQVAVAVGKDEMFGFGIEGTIQFGQADDSDSSAIDATHAVSQPFVAGKDAVSGVGFSYKTAGVGTIVAGIYEIDYATGYPTVALVRAQTFAVGATGGLYVVGGGPFVSGGHFVTAELVKGKMYALCIFTTGITAYIGRDNTPETGIFSCQYNNAGAWSTVAGKALNSTLAAFDREIVPSDQYTFDAATGRLLLYPMPSKMITFKADAIYALVHYYYNSKTAQQILTLLGQLDDVLHTTFSFPVGHFTTKTFPIYRTNGRSAMECMREILDGFNCIFVGISYQGVVSTLNDPWTLYFGRRKSVVAGDAPAFLFSTDSADPDDQLRVISYNLTKDGRRPATIIVVGQDASGNAIVTQVDDRTLGHGVDSFRYKSLVVTQERVEDSGINTLALADDVGMAAYDRMTRDVWEGDITIDGTYPDLFDTVVGSATQGSGEVIELSIPGLGIDVERFKVKGIVMTETRTLVKLTNVDVLLDNKVNLVSKKAERLESSVGPTTPDSQVFIGASDPAHARTEATLYMQLESAVGVPLTGLTRVACTKRSLPRLAQTRYQAVFEMNNGHTTDGVDLIACIELYDVATGGSYHARHVLNTGHQIPKWRTTRIIVEFMCWDGT
jgi:hypothetical protein